MKGAEGNNKSESSEDKTAIDHGLIQLLSNQTGASVEEIKSVLEHSEGDLQKLINNIREIAPSYIAIKGKFQPRKKDDLNGIFCLVAKGMTGEIVAFKAWVGSKDLPAGFDVKAAWESVYSYITTLETPHDNQSQRRFEKILGDYFTNTTLNKLFSSKLNLAEAQKSLYLAIMGIFRSDLTVEIDVEKFNEIRYKLSPLAGKDEEEIPKEEFEEEAQRKAIQNVTLTCIPKLDVIKGKPVADLKEGDMVEASIASSSPLGKFINGLFAGSKLTPTFKVKSVQRLPSGDCLVRLFISDGMEGVFKSSGEIKVSISPTKSDQQKRDSYLIMILISVIIVLMLFFTLRR
ncbi:ubiquitin [Acetomicrobium sp.]|jgi:hypothetical protein|uniref:ubiquitin n=1 Tax=Acetomicrobium sp. TaxID=1872099 RepID=UPI003D96B0D3